MYSVPDWISGHLRVIYPHDTRYDVYFGNIVSLRLYNDDDIGIALTLEMSQYSEIQLKYFIILSTKYVSRIVLFEGITSSDGKGVATIRADIAEANLLFKKLQEVTSIAE